MKTDGEVDDCRKMELTPPGAQQIFIRLFVANQRRIHVFVRMLVPRSADADDVLQESSITGLAKFADSFLKDRDSNEIHADEFVAWICTIARFEALKWYRQRKRGHLIFSEQLTEELAASYIRRLDGLETRHDALQACLEKLPIQDRTVLMFRYDSNLTGPEISKRLGRPLNTIYKALQRIRNNLSECVDRSLRQQGHSSCQD